MTIYNMTPTVPTHTPHIDIRELQAEFDGVLIESLPRMMAEDGQIKAVWKKILLGSHADDSSVRMETCGARYGGHLRWNRETRQREIIPDAPNWEGRIVIYATMRYQPGDVVRVQVWNSEYNGENRLYWRFIWTASPQVNGRTLRWIERPGGPDADESFPDALWVSVVRGGPDGNRRMGALVVDEPGDPNKDHGIDE